MQQYVFYSNEAVISDGNFSTTYCSEDCL